MNKTLAAATIAALVGAAGAASAADIYAPSSLKDGPAYVPLPTWTGFYIGAHVGTFWSDLKSRDLGGYLGYGQGYAWNDTNDNVFGGGQVGYNWQTGAFVLGVEADFGGAGLSRNWNNGVNYFWTKEDGSFYADVTGRLGYATGAALFYAKGGWAYLDSNISIGGRDIFGNPWSVSSNALNGWTVGGGIEYALNPSWSLKAEYLYFDFSRNNANWYDAYYNYTWNFDHDLTVNSFKVGANYRLSNFYAPLK